ncbi:TonB-dependent receptor [Hydrogenophaga sp.]|uniref:TonB-dependent receptor family protein n=1 Tax=Hydrogenophaga sp. TaxID=1904254 RepID=UPI00286E468C|nr:TonB-dependent receptor [Hydrogenophaga sp.]
MPRHPTFTLRPLHAALCILLAGPAGAQTLPDVVVSANRQEQQSFDAPASIHAVGQDAIEAAGPRVNLSESLNRVPGITVLNRQNYAQDLQLSIRGSGARSPFGIRGARLIVDGIPATMPDGQGQASTISLPSAQRIEVLRGPLAQLYGNSAGGVVQVFTADGPERPELRMSVDAGPDGLSRYGLQAAGQSGAVNYVVDVSDFQTDGWRENSAAERQHLNAKLRWDASEQTRVTVVANVFDQPVSGDPVGLTRGQMEDDPRQAVANATLYHAGKDVAQRQLGLVLDHRLGADASVMARVYAGQRDLDNRLSIPLFVQTAPTASGGVVRLDRQYSGVGLRYSRRLPAGDGQVLFSLGLDHERMGEHRQGYINNLGVQGDLKRDEQDSVHSTGVYAQADWAINEDWSALAGLRANRVAFRVKDAFITGDNPDDSGTASFSATNPVLGITRHLSADTNLYANIGRGFETPTFTELAYRADGSGPNLGLGSASSTHAELGLKTRLTEQQRLDVALFNIASRNEIVVASSSGGRTVYANAGRTRRSGVEVTHSAQWTPEWRSLLALSTLKAQFAEAFTSSGGAVVAAGNRIPGILDRTLFAELAWQPRAWAGFTGALELVHRGSMVVNDLNEDRTDAVTLFNLRLGWQQTVGAWTLRETLRVDNLTDRAYVGSVIVNDGNKRYFEPAPGRQWGLGLTATYRF